MAITEEQVFSAAEEIRESGRFPSAISIREIIKTGSLGTIQKHLRKWRHRETVSAASSNPPPEDVLETLKNFGDTFWRLAIQHSDKAALQKVRLARDEQDEARIDMEEALENLERQRIENEAMSSKVDETLDREKALHTELSLQKDLVQKASLQCHQREEALKSLDGRYRDLEKTERELHLNVSELRNDVEKSDTEKSELQNHLNTTKNAFEQLKADSFRISEELAEEKNLSDVLKKETEALRQKLLSEENRHSQIKSEKEKLNREIQDEKAENKQIREELRNAQIQFESTQIINQRLEALLEKLTPNQNS